MPPTESTTVRSRWVGAVGIALVGGFALTTLVAAGRSFHPLPFGDAWDGAITYWSGGRRFGWSALWALHNEHRIPWSRALFWLDVRLFDAGQTFLVLVNGAIVVAVAAVLGWVVRSTLREAGISPRTGLSRWTVSSTVAIAVAAVQLENIVGPFQSTLLLAVAMPLLACACAGASLAARGRRRATLAWIASAVGVASVGTAASGLAAPFCVALVLWAGGVRIRRVGVDLALGAACALLYGVGARTAGAGSIGSSLSSPFRVIRYVFAWYGSTVGAATFHRVPSEPFGIAFVLATIHVVQRALRREVRRPFELAAIGHLVVVLLGGIATAAGRSRLGIDQALESRYQTLVLSGLVLLVALLVADPPATRLRPATAALALVALPIGLLPMQARSLVSGPQIERPSILRVAAVALALGADDRPLLAIDHPDVEHLRQIVRDSTAKGLTVLARAPYRSLDERMGRRVAAASTSGCRARLVRGATLPDGDHRRLAAVVARGGASTGPDGVTAVVDRSGRTVGFVVVGVRSPALRRLFAVTVTPDGTGEELALGYVAARAIGPLRIVVGAQTCPSITE